MSKDGEFAFERPEQVQISSTCQGQSVHVILSVLEKLYCAAVQKRRLEIKGLQEPEDILTGLPQPTPPAKEAGSWWELEVVADTCLRGVNVLLTSQEMQNQRVHTNKHNRGLHLQFTGGEFSPSKKNKVFREEPLQHWKPCQSCAFILHAPWGVTLPTVEKSLNK